MDLRELKTDIDNRLDRIETKLDSFLVTSAEHGKDISWLKGAVNLGSALLLAALSGALGLIFKLLKT